MRTTARTRSHSPNRRAAPARKPSRKWRSCRKRAVGFPTTNRATIRRPVFFARSRLATARFGRRERQQLRNFDARAVRLGLGERLGLRHRREAPLRKLLVAARALDLPRELLLGEIAHDLGGNAGDERTGRN